MIIRSRTLRDAAAFVALAFLISLLAFAGIALLPGASSPESPRGLPFWLLAVWGPTLAAIALASRAGERTALLRKWSRVREVPRHVWALAVSPFALLSVLAWTGSVSLSPQLTPMTVLALLGFNLVLGPLGEELGWRGWLQSRLQTELGWIATAVLVGAVWFTWHLPLWLVDSPQRAIPVSLFAGHCFAYALILGAMQQARPDTVVPAVLFHLGANVVAGLAVFGEAHGVAEWYRMTLLPYAALAATVIVIGGIRRRWPSAAHRA